VFHVNVNTYIVAQKVLILLVFLTEKSGLK